MDTPRTIPIHPALTRPLLLAGGDRRLVILLWTGVVALIVTYHWLSWLVGLLVGGCGHWALVRIAKFDPDARGVWVRHLGYRSFYAAQASVDAAPADMHSAVPLKDSR